MNNINLNNQLPAFCGVVNGKFSLNNMYTLFKESVSDDEKSRIMTELFSLECSCGNCGVSMGAFF